MLQSSFWHQKAFKQLIAQLIQVFNVNQTTIFPQHPSSYSVSNSGTKILLHSTQLGSSGFEELEL